MSSPRPNGRVTHGTGGAALAAPPASALVEVVAVTECIIGSRRVAVGEHVQVPPSSVDGLMALGFVMPDAWMASLSPNLAAHWQDRPRKGLTDRSMVVDAETVAMLWDAPGRVLVPDGWGTTYQPVPPSARATRVLQLTQYDPGSAVYRYHSAANTVPGVVSAFVRWGDSNPHCSLRQWDGVIHQRTVEALALTADVIHVHMDFRTLTDDLRVAVSKHQRLAITYHGSVLPDDTRRVFVDHERDERLNAIQFGARPYHGRYGVTRYLPIPVPVADYRMAAAGHRRGDRLRVAHSPTRREIKGTQALVDAVAWLNDTEGLRIELVLIEGMDHGEALRVKASCDVTFDSFWLGMQGSGIEGAAMGQVVIAGDTAAAAEAAALNDGAIPWTFADDKYALVDVLRRVATNPAWAQQEAARVHDYVTRWHDYPAVGARYRNYLTKALYGTPDDN